MVQERWRKLGAGMRMDFQDERAGLGSPGSELLLFGGGSERKEPGAPAPGRESPAVTNAAEKGTELRCGGRRSGNQQVVSEWCVHRCYPEMPAGRARGAGCTDGEGREEPGGTGRPQVLVE